MQDTVPFPQILQSEEDPSPFFSIREPIFLRLSSLQNLKEPWELESFLSESGSQSDTNRYYQNQVSASSMEGTKQALSSQEADMMLLPSSSPPRKRKNRDLLAPDTTREKRKRRKTKPSKNIEEIENQRINHIAVERNRRRQMNEHINSLRSLLPPSCIQRGDQASIVGGAINYAKVLEQVIQSLESQKRTQQSSVVENRVNYRMTCGPRIEATVIQNHVNLKVVCRKKQGELIKGIISLEKLRLTVLHLSISTSSRLLVSYCFNLKMEDGCELESTDEITKAAHQIFNI